MDKVKVTEQNLGRIFNSRRGLVIVTKIALIEVENLASYNF
jgi:hypothetical protein